MKYNTSATFLEGIGEFVKHRLGYKFPTTWGGFNVCMTPIPSEKGSFLFVTRVFMTHNMLFANRIVPGTKYMKKSEKTAHMRAHDWSEFFPWGDWGNGIEMSVMFVGKFDSVTGFEINNSYTPFILNGCKSHFQKPPCVAQQARELGIPDMLVNPSFQLSCSDYRIFTLGEDIILHDAYTNYLRKVTLNSENGTIRFSKWITSVCKLPKEDYDGDFKNYFENGKPYFKYFDKNWSFIGMQDSKMTFIDWFYVDGVHGISLDTTTGECIRNVLVPFKKDQIPRTASELYPDFSIGSTTMSMSNNNIDVIGVGHVKFHWEYINLKSSKLHEKVANIDTVFRKSFGKMYKRHIKYVYACFFYRIKQTKTKFKMTMSDLWIPYFPKETNRYHSLVTFPMSVTAAVHTPRQQKKLYVTAGLSDFYNVVMTFETHQVIKSLVHDVSKMDMEKLNIDLVEFQDGFKTISSKPEIQPAFKAIRPKNVKQKYDRTSVLR